MMTMNRGGSLKHPEQFFGKYDEKEQQQYIGKIQTNHENKDTP